MTGILYLVPTPIGNLGEITPRAVKILKEVDFIASEDTRVTGKLLHCLGIRKEQMSYYEHNRVESGERIVARLLGGESCALCTDAGTPAISDPGEDLVLLATQNGIATVPLSGACALITGLIASGLPTGRFTFEGFLSVNRRVRKIHLRDIKNERRTMIFYEAPHKLQATLVDLRDALGDRRIAVCRELTKLHEEILRTTLTGAILHFSGHTPRGEFVLVIEGAPSSEDGGIPFESATEKAAQYRGEGMSLREASAAAAQETGHSRNAIYKALLENER